MQFWANVAYLAVFACGCNRAVVVCRLIALNRDPPRCSASSARLNAAHCLRFRVRRRRQTRSLLSIHCDKPPTGEACVGVRQIVPWVRIVLFPLNIWALELLEGFSLRCIFGFNPAWEYHGW